APGADMIVRLAEAPVKRQLVDDAVLDDRNLDFAERLAHVEVSGDVRNRTARAGEIAGLGLEIIAEVETFLAIFHTDVDSDAGIRPWRLKAIIRAGHGDVRVGD